MMLAGHIVVAADDRRFCQMEAKRGIAPLGGAHFWLLTRAGWATPYAQPAYKISGGGRTRETDRTRHGNRAAHRQECADWYSGHQGSRIVVRRAACSRVSRPLSACPEPNATSG